MEYRIRMATVEDAAAIRDIYAPFCTDSAVSFEESPPSIEEMANRIQMTTATHPWLVAVAPGDPAGVVLGYVYAGKHRERAAYRWSVDVTAYLAESSRGRGIGTALYRALFAILRVQGFYRAYAGITMPNPASVGLHRSLGFREFAVYRSVGYKAGSWRDVAWWELELLSTGAVPGTNAPGSAPPAPPRPITELAATPELRAILEARRTT